MRQIKLQCPSAQNVWDNCKRQFAAFEAANERHKQAPSEEEKISRIASMRETIAQMSELPDEARNYEELRKLCNLAAKEIAGRTEKKVSVVTEGSKKAVWYLMNNLVRKNMERIWRYDYATFLKYHSGEIETLAITVSTEYFAQLIGYDASCFRGKNGYYQAMEELEIARREHFNREGEKVNMAWDVTLQINVKKFFFGHEIAVIPLDTTPFLPMINEQSRGNSTQIDTEKVKTHKHNESGEADASSDSAANAAPNQVEGESSSVTPVDSTPQSNFSAAPPRQKNDEKTAIAAEKLLKLIQKTLFNAENLKKGRIRTDAQTILPILTRHTLAVAEERIENILTRLTAEMSLEDAIEKIINYTEKVGEMLQNGKKAYIYGPEMWLRMDFQKGTLWSGITKTDSKADRKSDDNPDADALRQNAAFGWVLDHDFNPATLNMYRKKHGDVAIYWAIRYVREKIRAGFAPKSNLRGYIFSVLKNLDASTIEAQTTLLMAKNQPKAGEIWSAWRNIVLEKVADPIVQKAWNMAQVRFSNDRTAIVIECRNDAHVAALESDVSIAAWKEAIKISNLKFKIQYVQKA